MSVTSTAPSSVRSIRPISANSGKSNRIAGAGEFLEARGVEPVFPEKPQVINYAENRAWFRSGEIQIFDSSGNVERVIPFTQTDRRL